jgi:hypothetical protein
MACPAMIPPYRLSMSRDMYALQKTDSGKTLVELAA